MDDQPGTPYDLTCGFPWDVKPPSDVCWFRFAPVTIVIEVHKSTINYHANRSEIGVINNKPT